MDDASISAPQPAAGTDPRDARAPVPLADGGWRAALALRYAREDGHTVPVLRRHSGPLRVQKGFTPEGPELWHQVIVHPPGGIAAGDSLAIDVDVDPDAGVLITSPGAAKWYRGDGGTATQTVQATVADRGSLEWLPLETIVFGGSNARLVSRFALHPTARLIAADLVCLGRPASGDHYATGTLHTDLEILVGGRLAFTERARLDAASGRHGGAPVLGVMPAFGQLLAAGPEVDDAMVTACREALASVTDAGESAVTRVDRIVLVRWRGRAAEDGWRVLRAAWSALRPRLLGRAACPPRIWAT